MNAKTIILLQLSSLILTLGTAEHIFTNIYSTLIFTISLICFAKCSIYINENEKWLLKNSDDGEKQS